MAFSLYQVIIAFIAGTTLLGVALCLQLALSRQEGKLRGLWLALALSFLATALTMTAEFLIYDQAIPPYWAIRLNIIQHLTGCLVGPGFFFVAAQIAGRPLINRWVLGSIGGFILVLMLDLTLETGIFLSVAPTYCPALPSYLILKPQVLATPNPNWYWILALGIFINLGYILYILGRCLHRNHDFGQLFSLFLALVTYLFLGIACDVCFMVAPYLIPPWIHMICSSFMAQAWFPVFATALVIRGRNDELQQQTRTALEAQAKAERTEAYIQSVYRLTPVPLLVLDRAGCIVTMNQPAVALFPGESSAIGKRLVDLLPPDSRPAWNGIHRTGGNQVTIELTDAEGESGEYLLQLSSPQSDGSVVLAISDMAAIRFTGSRWIADRIIHEINNQLTGISFARDIMTFFPEKQPEIPDILTSSLGGIRSSLGRLSTLMGRGEAEITLFDFSDPLQESATYVSTQRDDIECHFEVQSSHSIIEGNKSEIYLLLVNLLKNAVEAMPSGGTIRLAVWEVERSTLRVLDRCAPGSYLLIRIQDAGRGISPDVRDHLFEAGLTTKDHGSGFGLYNSREMARRHGGELWLDATSEVGTSFLLALPLVSAAASAPVNAEHVPANIAHFGSAYRALVVDDVEISAAALGNFLQRAKFQVTVCTNPREALTLVRDPTHPLDLLVTDFRMPEMNGSTLIRESLLARPALRAIVCTAVLNEPEMVVLQRMSGVEILQKPIEMRDFLLHVRQLLDSK